MRVLLLTAVILVPAIATAQPGPDDDSPPGMTAARVVSPPPPAPLDVATSRDAASDRAFMTSTALVVPAGGAEGSLRIAPHGGGVASAVVGLGNGIEISGDVAGAIEETMVGAGIKIQAAHGRTWAFAVQGSIHKIAADDDDQEKPATIWSAGALYTAVNDDATAVLTFGGGAVGARQGETVPYAWASVSVGAGAFRPVLETFAANSGFVGFLGIRLSSKHLGIEGGVMVVSDGDKAVPVPAGGLAFRL